RSQSATPVGSRATMIVCLPQSLELQMARKHRDLFVEDMEKRQALIDARPLEGAGFIGVDAAVRVDDGALADAIQRFMSERLQAAEFHPDAWSPVVIRAPPPTRDRLAAGAGGQDH